MTNKESFDLGQRKFEERRMSYNLPPLPWLRAFEAAARLGNFTLAAEELALTPAAISHQVRSLEERLGYPLFLRRNRSLVLTRLGEAYLPALRSAFADLSLATTDVFGRGQQASLRVRCLQTFAQAWLLPRLPRFRATHPEIRLQLHTASWAGTVESEQLDLDILYGDGTWNGAEVEPLIQGKVLPLSAPALAMGVNDLASLAKAPLIEITGVSESWSRFFHRQGWHAPLPPPAMVVDQSSVALELAAQGAGHTLVFDAFAQRYLAEGSLAVSIPAAYQSDQGMYLMRAGGRQTSTDLEKLLAWLRTEASV